MNRETKPRIYNRGASSDFIVRMESGQGTKIKGKIEHIQTGQVQYFNDFLELLMLMQDRLDEKGYPQCDTELRNFSSSN